MGKGIQYIQLVKVLYCKLLTNGKQLPAFPLEVRPALYGNKYKDLEQVFTPGDSHPNRTVKSTHKFKLRCDFRHNAMGLIRHLTTLITTDIHI